MTLASKKPILCLDFDGVIHRHPGGSTGSDIITGMPVPGAIAFLISAHAYFNITIQSWRFLYPGGLDAVRDYLVQHGVERGYVATVAEMGDRDWDNGVLILAREKLPAFLTIDDRAITFTGVFPEPEALLKFRTWANP